VLFLSFLSFLLFFLSYEIHINDTNDGTRMADRKKKSVKFFVVNIFEVCVYSFHVLFFF